MQRTVFAVLILAAVGLLGGCDRPPKSVKGFVLPEGDAARGQAAFVSLQCTTCHRVEGVAGLPNPTVPPELVVLLGGEVHRLRTYGDLMTAVIHPSYELSERLPRVFSRRVPVSPMPEVNEKLTVAQMVDLVTFLQPRYSKLEPLYPTYGTGIQ
jgi:L-cysteine S-thiosulfotransferase